MGEFDFNQQVQIYQDHGCSPMEAVQQATVDELAVINTVILAELDDD